MAYSLSDYVNQFYRLLPSGPLWPTQDLSSSDWLAYIRAMVSEFQRVDAKAEEWLADYLPDETVTQLEDWERILSLQATLASFGIDIVSLSTAQRQALVLATIRLAPFTPADLEAMATALGFTATVTQPARATRYAGFLSGQRYGGAGHARAFLYEYAVNETPAPSDLSDVGWTKDTCTITTDDARAPDGTLTADLMDGTGTSDYGVMATTAGAYAQYSEIRLSVWVKVAVVGQIPDDVSLIAAQSGFPAVYPLDVPLDGSWRRFEQVHICTGSTAVTYGLYGLNGAGEDLHVWGFYAGAVDPLMELYLDRAKPVHTTALPRVIGDTQSWPLTYP